MSRLAGTLFGTCVREVRTDHRVSRSVNSSVTAFGQGNVIPRLESRRRSAFRIAAVRHSFRRHLCVAITSSGRAARGFHSFRRFRAEHLENSLPGSDVLRKLWLGHSLSDVSEKYVKNLKHNTLVRTMSAQKAGLGFELRPVAPTSALVNPLNNWSGREDLNLRPPGPEPGALPG